MNKRYYYTDPLAAYWMAKHHLISFDLSEDEFRGWATEIQLPVDRYYIHPDCVAMLKPQPADLKIIRIPEPKARTSKEFQEALAESLGELHQMEERVILRNGIAFMWPESEEV